MTWPLGGGLELAIIFPAVSAQGDLAGRHPRDEQGSAYFRRDDVGVSPRFQLLYAGLKVD